MAQQRLRAPGIGGAQGAGIAEQMQRLAIIMSKLLPGAARQGFLRSRIRWVISSGGAPFHAFYLDKFLLVGGFGHGLAGEDLLLIDIQRAGQGLKLALQALAGQGIGAVVAVCPGLLFFLQGLDVFIALRVGRCYHAGSRRCRLIPDSRAVPSCTSLLAGSRAGIHC